eukprot:s5274_g1.t1
MATASVTVPGFSGVIPCPLPATVEDAICAAQKMQPGGWENAVLSQGEEISANPRGTSFYKAMKLIVGVVLILDQNATPFERIWCCFEESIAVEERNTGMPLLLDVAATDSSNE